MVKNSGFVAYAIEGSYDVLAIVDQTHLPTPVKDHITGATLGWYDSPIHACRVGSLAVHRTDEVSMSGATTDGRSKQYVVALLCVASSWAETFHN